MARAGVHCEREVWQQCRLQRDEAAVVPVELATEETLEGRPPALVLYSYRAPDGRGATAWPFGFGVCAARLLRLGRWQPRALAGRVEQKLACKRSHRGGQQGRVVH